MTEEQKKRFQENLNLIGTAVGANEQDFQGQALATSMLGNQQPTPIVNTPAENNALQPIPQEADLRGIGRDEVVRRAASINEQAKAFGASGGEAFLESQDFVNRAFLANEPASVVPAPTEALEPTPSPNVMGVEDTRAKLLEEFGAPTISQIQESPTLGLRTDPQGRMIPSAGMLSDDASEAAASFRDASMAREMRAMQPSGFGEAVSDRERRIAEGRGISMSDARALAAAKLPGASERDVARGIQIQEDYTTEFNPRSLEIGGQQLIETKPGSFELIKQPTVKPEKPTYTMAEIEKMGDLGSVTINPVGDGKFTVTSQTIRPEPTPTVSASEQKQKQLAKARKLYNQGKTNEANDVLASLGMKDMLGVPLKAESYFGEREGAIDTNSATGGMTGMPSDPMNLFGNP